MTDKRDLKELLRTARRIIAWYDLSFSELTLESNQWLGPPISIKASSVKATGEKHGLIHEHPSRISGTWGGVEFLVDVKPPLRHAIPELDWAEEILEADKSGKIASLTIGRNNVTAYRGSEVLLKCLGSYPDVLEVLAEDDPEPPAPALTAVA